MLLARESVRSVVSEVLPRDGVSTKPKGYHAGKNSLGNDTREASVLIVATVAKGS